MNNKEKKVTRVQGPAESARMVETIVGCKWSLTVFQLLSEGINRPGEMVRAVDGLSAKVLNQCLKRNVEFGIVEKQVFAQVPPKVEYHITEFGEQFIEILASLDKLQRAISTQSLLSESPLC